MTKEYFHGTSNSFPVLRRGSWVTQILGHAVAVAEKQGLKAKTPAVVVSVIANDGDLRTPTEADRKPDNLNNDFAQEPYVFITLKDIPVNRRLSLCEAKSANCAAINKSLQSFNSNQIDQ